MGIESLKRNEIMIDYKSTTISVEDLEIGKMLYSFDLSIDYSIEIEGDNIDSPMFSETDIEQYDFSSPVMAFDTETETEYEVTEKAELKMIMDWVNVESLLEKTF